MAGVIGEARHTWKVAQFSAQPKFVHDIFVSRLRSAYSDDPAHWPTPHVDPDVDFQEIAPPVLPGPDQWDSPLAKLGQTLFEDPALSASGHFFCQSCHNRRPGWGDGLPRSFGHGRQESTRNAQPLFAMAGMESFFWDGRAATLAEQSLSPLLGGA
nr:cytochrome-c peroxidase [Sagittula salina]